MSDSKKDSQVESRRIIDRVELESEAAMPRSGADRMSIDNSGHDMRSDSGIKAADDRIELWGTRIGRWLGLALLAYILWWLYDFMTMGG